MNNIEFIKESMPRKHKVRRHLGRGENYMKGQIRTNKETLYIEDDEWVLMKDCYLRNQVGGTKKIAKGANKSVVAWIECSSFDVFKLTPLEDLGGLRLRRIYFNPRVSIHWHRKNPLGLPSTAENLDGQVFQHMVYHRGEVYEVIK